MFSLICKTFPHLKYSARSSYTVFNSYGTKAVDESLNLAKKDSFIVSYLVDRCGVDREKALSVSNNLRFKTPEKADSVLSLLKNHGFTQVQISKIVQRCPQILLCDAQNTLLPKVDFFKSLGFTVQEYTNILCRGPSILKRSLENQLSPTVDFLKNFSSSPEKLRLCMKRSPWIFSTSCHAVMEDNIQLLREMEVPESRIMHYFHNQPRLFTMKKSKFKKILEEIEGLGFDPSRKTFIAAVHVFCSMSKSTWKKKIHVYKKWGLSEDQILEAFGRSPWLMSCSEEKIDLAMDFLINKMGFSASDLMKTPVIIMLSLKNRIIPRCFVYQTLSTEGLVNKDLKLLRRMLFAPEAKFLTNFVKCYENKIPKLLKLYQSSNASDLGLGSAKVEFS